MRPGPATTVAAAVAAVAAGVATVAAAAAGAAVAATAAVAAVDAAAGAATVAAATAATPERLPPQQSRIRKTSGVDQPAGGLFVSPHAASLRGARPCARRGPASAASISVQAV